MNVKYSFLATGVFSLTIAAICAMLLTKGPALMHVLPAWMSESVVICLCIFGLACLLGYQCEVIGDELEAEAA